MWLQPDLKQLARQQAEIYRYTASMRDVRIRWYHVSGEVYREPVSKCLGFLVPFILVDGTVYPCCALTEGNQRKCVRPQALGNVGARRGLSGTADALGSLRDGRHRFLITNFHNKPREVG